VKEVAKAVMVDDKGKSELKFYQDTPKAIKTTHTMGQTLMLNRRALFIAASALHLYSAKKARKPNEIIKYAIEASNVVNLFGQVLKQPEMGPIVPYSQGNEPASERLMQAFEQKGIMDQLGITGTDIAAAASIPLTGGLSTPAVLAYTVARGLGWKT